MHYYYKNPEEINKTMLPKMLLLVYGMMKHKNEKIKYKQHINDMLCWSFRRHGSLVDTWPKASFRESGHIGTIPASCMPKINNQIVMDINTSTKLYKDKQHYKINMKSEYSQTFSCVTSFYMDLCTSLFFFYK